MLINGTNSKEEQGNDNLIACDGNDSFTATESTQQCLLPYDATQQQLPQQQQQQFSDTRG